MKKVYLQISVIVLTLGFTIIMSGCSMSTTPDSVVTVTASPTFEIPTTQPPTSTHEPTLTNTPTSSPTLTKTATASRTPTVTASPTNTATWTPVPTLHPDEALEEVLKLYADNGGCELPCWWGITPGETTWEATHQLLAPLGIIAEGASSRNGVVIFSTEFIVPKRINPRGYLGSAIWVKDGVVIAISLGGNRVMDGFDYSLAGLLEMFGQPEEIWLEIHPKSSDDKPYYYLQLFYPTLGIKIGSQRGFAQVREDVITLCPAEFSDYSKVSLGFLLWSSTETVDFKEIDKVLLDDLIPWHPDKYQLLEDLTTDIDNAAFYETYVNPNTNDCFDVALDAVP